MGTFGRFDLWMSRIWRRIPVLAALAVLAATPALASAASPSYYILKSAKAHCRSGYAKKTVTITVKRNHRKVKVHQLRCVKKGSSLPSGLPTVTVTPTIVPTASGHTYTTNAGQALGVGAPGVLAGATGHGLTASLVSGPTSGTLALGKGGGFSYAPAAGASGIVHFVYRVADLNGTTSKPATVTIDVMPVAVGAGYSVASNTTLSLSAAQLLGGDTGTGLTPSLATTTSHGSLALGAAGMTYTPSPGFSGSDSFTYAATDADGLTSNTATVTINVGAVPPSAGPQSFSGAVGNTPLRVGSPGAGLEVYEAASSPLLAGDSDPNGGGALTVTPESAVPTARGGVVTVEADGSFTYTPPVGFDGPGTDSFTYEVNTTELTSASETATISFTGARVWYVNNATGPGNGSAGSPFNTFGAASAQATAGDDIYLFHGSGDYTGGVVLPSGVALVGQGSALVVGGDTLAAAGSAPFVANGAGAGITIAGGGSVSGVNVHNTSGAGVSLSGSAVVGLDAMAISSSGGDGINAGFSGDAQLTIANLTISSTAGDGIHLADSSGAFKVAAQGNTIGSVGSGAGISLDGSTATEVDLTLVPFVDPLTSVSTPNTITVNDSGAGNNGVSIAAGTGSTCLNATGNHITAGGTGSYAMSLSASATPFYIQGIGGTPNAAAVETYLNSPLNTLSGVAGNVLATGSTYQDPGGTCPAPSGGVTS